jgi:hypothetical protein
VALLGAAVAIGAGAPLARADHTQISIFQDDQHLVLSPTATVRYTLFVLKLLGVEVIRTNLEWAYVAPDPQSRHAPAGFDAADPAQYPGWGPYDRLVRLAGQDGIGVQVNLTAPGPLWAMGSHPPDVRGADHWYPSAVEFARFVYAAGVHYSGRVAGVPAVHDWSIWNEPNQPGWLAPQSQRIGGREVAVSPRLYRRLLRYAMLGLYLSGHARDRILIGELAPEGDTVAGFYDSLAPMPFLRALYCVGERYRPLRGAQARALGCTARPSHAAFVKANPLLFYASGFAQHPYYFFHPPSYSSPDPDFVPLGSLGRLERGLDRALGAWVVDRRLPIYITEYGYQTNPPDPYQIVTPAQQAVYLNQADYIAWRDPRVRSVAQFLLYDSAPDPLYAPDQFGYWDTFQTGLMYTDGQPKPALYAYAMPIWIPDARFRPRSSILVWGQLRPAPPGRAVALVQWQAPGGSWRALGQIATTNPRHYFTVRVRPPGSGAVRIAWRAAPRSVLYSRSAPVTILAR